MRCVLRRVRKAARTGAAEVWSDIAREIGTASGLASPGNPQEPDGENGDWEASFWAAFPKPPDRSVRRAGQSASDAFSHYAE